MIGIINFGYGNIQSIINALNDAEIKRSITYWIDCFKSRG